MNQLSGLDALFLHLETPEMPMHVGALHVFELPATYRGSFLRDVREHVASRLPLIPAFRRRLSWMPANLSNPAWVEAAPDLTRHVVGFRLPRGSGIAELEEQVGLFHPVLLDRSRPLWKMHIFDGLEPGPDGERRFGLYTQLHHAAVDGQAAVAIAQVLLDPSAAGRQLPAITVRREPVKLEMAQMLRGALQQQVSQLGQLARALPGAVGTLVGLAADEALTTAGAALRRAVKAADAPAAGGPVRNFSLAPRTRLNVAVSRERHFATATLPLDELRAVRQRLGLTLNDAVLMVCSGALRRFFQRHGPLPRKSLVAAVPISLRGRGDTESNNQASMTLVSLGTHLADPARRLAHIRAATASMKATVGSDRVKNLLPTDFPSLGVPWLVQGLTRVVGRSSLIERVPPVANLVISNVPGPPAALYMAGARMLSNHPASIVVHGLALNITVQTYDQSLDIGLMACAQALPEVAELAAHLATAFEELKAIPAASVVPADPPPKASAARKTPAARRPRASPAPKPRKAAVRAARQPARPA